MALVNGIITIVFGILVLAFPKFLRWVVGIYFLIQGIMLLI